MKLLVLILSLVTIYSTSSQAAASPAIAPIKNCATSAETIIRKTIESMGLNREEYDFKIEETKHEGKSFDGAPIITYSVNTIIAPEGFFPGASAAVTLVSRNSDCILSKIVVDLNSTLPE